MARKSSLLNNLILWPWWVSAILAWKDFEYLRGGADGGVDLVVRKDGKRILVQCKNWRKRPVGVATVRELYGVVQAEGADGGMVLSSGHFTNDARKFAGQNGITLMDGTKLLRKIQHIPDALPTTPQGCPKCGSPMVLRRAKRGRYAGTHFYGCSEYPRCRGIRH